MRHRERQQGQERRRMMHRLKEMEFSNAAIGRLYDISGGRVGQILRHKPAEDNLLGVSVRAYNVLQRALGTQSPTLIDVSRFIRASPFWRQELHKARNCGKTTIAEIERFAEDNGIKVLPERKLRGLGKRAYELVAKALGMESPDLSDLRRLMRDDSWRERLGEIQGCGPRTIAELESYGSSKGLTRKSL